MTKKPQPLYKKPTKESLAKRPLTKKDLLHLTRIFKQEGNYFKMPINTYLKLIGKGLLTFELTQEGKGIAVMKYLRDPD